MIELFQAEWCPASRRVRQRLTELGIDYVNRQVPVDREARALLRDAVGADTIPALRLENFDESREAEAHRERAAEMRGSFLERRVFAM